MGDVWVEAVVSLGVGVGLAAAVGLRVFLPLLLLGAAARLGWVPLTDGFEWLASGVGLSTLLVATALEISAYYVPWVDNLLDMVAGPLAVVAGILVTAAVTTDLPPAVRWAAAIIAGGGTAGIVQSLTSVARLKTSATTAGTGNWVLATLELFGSLITSVLAIVVPGLAILMLVGLVLVIRRVGHSVFRRARVGQAADSVTAARRAT
jgi:hypothetical protein